MKATISECERRRKIQNAFNEKHKITPETIQKAIHDGIDDSADEDANDLVWKTVGQNEEEYAFSNIVTKLEREMELAARNLQFEKAAQIRDKIKEIKGAC